MQFTMHTNIPLIISSRTEYFSSVYDRSHAPKFHSNHNYSSLSRSLSFYDLIVSYFFSGFDLTAYLALTFGLAVSSHGSESYTTSVKFAHAQFVPNLKRGKNNLRSVRFFLLLCSTPKSRGFKTNVRFF